uniref:RNA-directed DNA polymerase n=1 Tax=Ascaris lumbricoides TaxID=6252 RepID=A0A0M3HGT4_ASCLU
ISPCNSKVPAGPIDTITTTNSAHHGVYHKAVPKLLPYLPSLRFKSDKLRLPTDMAPDALNNLSCYMQISNPTDHRQIFRKIYHQHNRSVGFSSQTNAIQELNKTNVY